MDSKPDYIAVVDCGHGNITAMLYTLKTGKSKSASRPYMRAGVTGDLMGIGDQEIQTTWSEWSGRRYVTGRDALIVARSKVERHSGENRYGNELQRHLIADILARMGVKSGVIDLTVFVPPKFYAKLKQTITDRFMVEAKGQAQICLATDKKPRTFTYSAVNVLPEGLSGGLVLALNPDGTVNKNALLSSAVLIDQGMKTCDAVQVIGGQFNPEMLQFSTFEDAGIRKQMLEPMLTDIKQRWPSYAGLLTDDLDMVVRDGIATGSFVVDFAGATNDVTELYHYWREQYAGYIANVVIDEQYAGFRDVQYGIFHGGGAALTNDLMRLWYGEKVLDASKIAHAAKVPLVDWNAEGAMRKALANARKQRWIS